MLSAAADGDRWSAIETQAHLLVTAAEREVAEPADLAVVYAEAASLRRDLAARAAPALRPMPSPTWPGIPQHRRPPDRG